MTILNTHHDSGGDGMPFGWITIDGEHEAESTEMLRDLWTQIATAFRDAGERLVFEAFNEPRKTKWWGGPDGNQKGQDDWTGRTATWTKPLLVATFLDAWHGRLGDETFATWLAEVKAAATPPVYISNTGDVALRWAVGDADNYGGCWGQSMGPGVRSKVRPGSSAAPGWQRG